jgi:diadenosine tetraphosphate (Ap4A) HIT family hydrolase
MVASDNDCFVCEKHRQGAAAPGGVAFEDDLVFVGHILPPDLEDAYLGYLIVEPKRHVAGWGQLRDEEAAALGKTINSVAAALRDSEGAEHVYTLTLGDAVPHLHVHLIPRYPFTPREFWGLSVREWPDAPRGGEVAISALIGRVREALRA